MEYYEIYAWTDCPYCVEAKNLLMAHNKPFMFCCVDESDILLEFLKKKYKWSTVPMIIKKNTEDCSETFIGGYTDLLKLFRESDDR